jgi:threonine dehydratase
VLSGGNVDAGVLSAVAHWAETEHGRRLRVLTRVDDRPGGLAALLKAVADAGANVLDVEHVRDGIALHVGETGVELTLATRGTDHAEAICRGLGQAGFGVVRQAPRVPATAHA